MTDEEGATVPDAAPEAGAGTDILHPDWTYRLLALELFEADGIDSDGDDVFAVKFAVDGPNANAEVEILVGDHDDVADVIRLALDALHRAMTVWGRITENRRIAARDVVA